MLLPPDEAAASELIHGMWTASVKKISDDALEITPFGTMFSPDTLMGVEDSDAEYLERYLDHAKRDGWDLVQLQTARNSRRQKRPYDERQGNITINTIVCGIYLR
jgi:hypothetical protein